MSASGVIALATSPVAISCCHPDVRELRPHLADEEAFVAQVQRQQASGYRLAYLEALGQVRAVAGFRVLEKLSAGRFLYVDDLVTRAEDRSRAFGGGLLDWLADRAREENCATLELDSGVQRHTAHRFYLRKGMDITSHHLAVELSDLRRPFTTLF